MLKIGVAVMTDPKGQRDKGTAPAQDYSLRLPSRDDFMVAYMKMLRRCPPATPSRIWQRPGLSGPD